MKIGSLVLGCLFSVNAFAAGGELLINRIIYPNGNKSSCIVTSVKVYTSVGPLGRERTFAELSQLGAPHCRFNRAVDPQVRRYHLASSINGCGSKVYTSVGRVVQEGYSPLQYTQLQLQDNTYRLCDDYRPTLQALENAVDGQGHQYATHLQTVN